MQKVKINPVKKQTRPKSKIKAISKIPKTNPVNQIFKNKDVFIVGGGSSLSGFNFNLLKDKCVIAINRSFLHVPFAQVLYFSDYRFYMWATGKIGGDKELIDGYMKYNGLIYSIAPKIKDPKVKLLRNTGKTGFDTTNGNLKHGGNSGYAAINLAYHLGAKRIILMGYDMKIINGKFHFHKGYLSKQNQNIYKRFIEPYKYIADIADQLNLRIFNTSMNSDLSYFKKLKIENFL
jgi:hypothetical protein